MTICADCYAQSSMGPIVLCAVHAATGEHIAKLQRDIDEALKWRDQAEQAAYEALLKHTIEAKRLLGTGTENFKHWCDVRIAEYTEQLGARANLGENGGGK